MNIYTLYVGVRGTQLHRHDNTGPVLIASLDHTNASIEAITSVLKHVANSQLVVVLGEQTEIIEMRDLPGLRTRGVLVRRFSEAMYFRKLKKFLQIITGLSTPTRESTVELDSRLCQICLLKTAAPANAVDIGRRRLLPPGFSRSDATQYLERSIIVENSIVVSKWLHTAVTLAIDVRSVIPYCQLLERWDLATIRSNQTANARVSAWTNSGNNSGSHLESGAAHLVISTDHDGSMRHTFLINGYARFTRMLPEIAGEISEWDDNLRSSIRHIRTTLEYHGELALIFDERLRDRVESGALLSIDTDVRILYQADHNLFSSILSSGKKNKFASGQSKKLASGEKKKLARRHASTYMGSSVLSRVAEYRKMTACASCFLVLGLILTAGFSLYQGWSMTVMIKQHSSIVESMQLIDEELARYESSTVVGAINPFKKRALVEIDGWLDYRSRILPAEVLRVLAEQVTAYPLVNVTGIDWFASALTAENLADGVPESRPEFHSESKMGRSTTSENEPVWTIDDRVEFNVRGEISEAIVVEKGVAHAYQEFGLFIGALQTRFESSAVSVISKPFGLNTDRESQRSFGGVQQASHPGLEPKPANKFEFRVSLSSVEFSNIF